jgi:hypothetical protein
MYTGIMRVTTSLLYYIIYQPLSCLSFPLHRTFAVFCLVLPIEVYFFIRYKELMVQFHVDFTGVMVYFPHGMPSRLVAHGPG